MISEQNNSVDILILYFVVLCEIREQLIRQYTQIIVKQKKN